MLVNMAGSAVASPSRVKPLPSMRSTLNSARMSPA